MAAANVNDERCMPRACRYRRQELLGGWLILARHQRYRHDARERSARLSILNFIARLSSGVKLSFPLHCCLPVIAATPIEV